MKDNQAQQCQHPRDGYILTGSVSDRKTKKGLPGYAVTAFDLDQKDDWDLLGRAVTGFDGSFLLRYRKKDFITSIHEESYEGGPDVVLELRNRYGRVIKKTDPLIDAGRFEKINIEIEVRKDEQKPMGKKTPDPFTALNDQYPAETALLKKAGIENLKSLLTADLHKIAKKTGHDPVHLLAFRLHAEIGFVEDFPKQAALALAGYADISTRRGLSAAEPWKLTEAVKKAKESGLIDELTDYSSSDVFGWVGAAKGLDTGIMAPVKNMKTLIKSGRTILERIRKSNPDAYLADITHALNPWARLLNYAHVRSLMEEAGVHDLSTLGSFRIEGRRVIGPGFYVAYPTYHGVFSEFVSYMDDSLSNRKYFKSLKAHRDCLQVRTNPVDEAVIVGSVVDFVEDGQLVIGEGVSRMTIITEELRYSDVNSIVFENGDRTPPPAAPRRPARRGRGTPHHNPYEYFPGDGNDGRNGGDCHDAQDGSSGINGNVLGPAPDVSIHVRDMPEGLPDIILGGRRGGMGGQGQHGGHGGDGARGRKGHSGICRCQRATGRGGDGGDGGNGGNGGDGGRGGSAGSVSIYTLEDNIIPLATGRSFEVQITGGAGGNGGHNGEGGNPGRGGAPGEGKQHCRTSSDLAGLDGQPGNPGEPGENGPDGTSGSMELNVITERSWNAAFNTPYIIRMEPWEGHTGSMVQVIARNLTEETALIFGGSEVRIYSLDIETGTFEFQVPEGIPGGRYSIVLEVEGVDGRVHSNTQYFRVLPHLESLDTYEGFPGSMVTLSGTGFAIGLMVRMGDSNYGASVFDPQNFNFDLPAYDELDIEAGPIEIQVINPDGRGSEIMMFDLTIDIHIRIKAWRVMPEDDEVFSSAYGPGSMRSDDQIREMFTSSPTPAEIWAPHHIVLEFDPDIGIARAPSPMIDDWPRGNHHGYDYLTEYYEDGALNVYFVKGIEDRSLGLMHSPSLVAPEQWHIMICDAPYLSDWEETVLLSHEFGHAFSLIHTCGDDDTTFFGVACEPVHSYYLMHPLVSYFGPDGAVLHPREVITARFGAFRRFGE